MARLPTNLAAGINPSSNSLAPARSPGDASIKSPSRARRKPPPDWPSEDSSHLSPKSTSTYYQAQSPSTASPTPESAQEFQFHSTQGRSPSSSQNDTNVTQTNKFENDFNDIIHNIETEIDNFNINTSKDYDDGSSSVYDTDSPAKMSKSSINDPFSLGRDANEPLQNPLYSNSTPSISSATPGASIPYPLDSPIAPSPTGGTFDSAYTPSANNTAVFPVSGVTMTSNSTLYPMDSTDSDNPRYNGRPTTYNQAPTPYTPASNPVQSFNRTNSQATTSTQKSAPLKPTISTPITNLNASTTNSTADSLRQTSTNNSITNSLNNSFMANTTSSSAMNNPKFGHRKSSSISSILSTNSAKNVNLATLKKTLNFRPGEGERSTYVLTIRRNAGTAYNETAPGKWKLPTGIAPIDKRATYTSSNGKYMRMVGGLSQVKLKKGSGVELKHGHLAPRLLAAEVDDNDDNSLKTKNGTNGMSSLDENGGSSTPKTTKSSNSSLLMTPGAPSIESNVSSGKNSLSRTITENSVSSASNRNSKDSESEASRPRSESVISDSSGSISEAQVGMGGYYQHPGYKYDENGEEEFQDANEQNEETDMEEYDDYRDQPKLVLANPDTDSD